MKRIAFLLILLASLMLVGCNNCWLARVVELGDDFALVESDDKWIEIFYSYNRGRKCFDGTNTACVIPATVVAYNNDKHWIIAKSRSVSDGSISYWIVNKDFRFTRLGYDEELKQQTIGPLDSIQFELKLRELDIPLKLKDSRK